MSEIPSPPPLEVWDQPGGGTAGIVQFGMIKRLSEIGRRPDKIIACSSGSLNAAVVSMGDIDLLEHLWMNISNRTVRDLKPWLLVTKGKGCIYEYGPLAKTLQKYIDPAKFKIPVVVSVTNRATQQVERMRLDQPPAGMTAFDVLLSSVSIPVLVAPHMGVYYDGGVCDNYNVQAAFLSGATKIVLLHPNRPARALDKNKLPEIQNVEDSAGFTLRAAQWSNYLHQLEFLQLMPKEKRPEFKVIMPPDQIKDLRLFDFDYKGLDRKALILQGYNLVKTYIG